MKIILIGFMGSGKSTVGPLLAEKLNIPYFDTDREVIKLSKGTPIQTIFEREGETRFRSLEHEVAKELGALKEGVISTGGGFPLFNENVTHLGGNVVLLHTALTTVRERLKRATDQHLADRPLARDPEKLTALFDSRQAQYESLAHHIVQTDKSTPQEVVTKIMEALWS